MTRKEITVLLGAAGLAWHVLSIMKDARLWKLNVDRYSAAPTLPNLVRLAVAEGVLISDLS
jgi:hypothetical protein